ncbi:MAG: DUF6089 family protein [Chitinophagales bacterium]
MIFRKIYYITTFALLSGMALHAMAQEKEYGLWGGFSHSFGDINATKNSFQFAKPAGGIFFRYNKNDRIAYYFGAAYGSTYGEDAVASDTFRLARNLSFKTSIFEFSTRLEFNFLPLDRTKADEWFSPFMFIGINAYYFNPKAYYNDNWVELQPLGTEGQQFAELTGNDPYHRLQAAVPVGGGFKFIVGKNITVGMEAAWHKLFTDYLDDVSGLYVDPAILASGTNGELVVALADRSAEILDAFPIGVNGKQRGDSHHNDSYAFAGVFVSYTFVNLKCPEPGGRKKR